MVGAPQRLEAFAVEDTTVQLTWGALGTGTLSLVVDDRCFDIDEPARPGGLVIDDLKPGTRYEVYLSAQGRQAASAVLSFTTLAPAPGAELFRFATVSDLHLGMTNFGFFHTMAERPKPAHGSSVRCAEAAIAEALDWGAQELVVKGDITERGSVSDWAKAGDVLGGLPVPVHLVPGNHDVYRRRKLDPVAGARSAGLAMTEGWDSFDRPGVRLIVVDSSVMSRGIGRLPEDAEGIISAAAEAPAGVVIAMHHHLQTHPTPRFWPPGIASPEAEPFLDALAEANPSTLITSGHTHRNRSRTHRDITLTEVGSTKDYPGVWAGYVVYEGGIRQMVRRVQRPDCIGWTDYTRLAVNGMWARWSPGTIDQRSFHITWANQPSHSPGQTSPAQA